MAKLQAALPESASPDERALAAMVKGVVYPTAASERELEQTTPVAALASELPAAEAPMAALASELPAAEAPMAVVPLETPNSARPRAELEPNGVEVAASFLAALEARAAALGAAAEDSNEPEADELGGTVARLEGEILSLRALLTARDFRAERELQAMAAFWIEKLAEQRAKAKA